MVDQLLRSCVCNGVIQPCCRCIICCIGFCCIGVVKAAIQRIQLTLMVPARLHRIQLIQYTARIQYTAYTVYSSYTPPLCALAGRLDGPINAAVGNDAHDRKAHDKVPYQSNIQPLDGVDDTRHNGSVNPTSNGCHRRWHEKVDAPRDRA